MATKFNGSNRRCHILLLAFFLSQQRNNHRTWVEPSEANNAILLFIKRLLKKLF
jgi:hypothetical protein